MTEDFVYAVFEAVWLLMVGLCIAAFGWSAR